MPFMKNGKRNYDKELEWEHSNKPMRVKQRAMRNAARAEMGMTKGDGMHVDHKKHLSAGGTNAKSNLRVLSAKANMKREANRKKSNARGR